MKATVEVATRAEGTAVKAAAKDQETKALAVVLGTLAELSPGAQQRTLRYVNERFDAETDTAD